MDFLCFYFPLFCIHWLMEHYLLSANTPRNANNLRSYTMGVQSVAKMGKQLG